MSAAVISFPADRITSDVVSIVPAAEEDGPFLVLVGRFPNERTFASGLNLGPAVRAAMSAVIDTGAPLSPDTRLIIHELTGGAS